MKKMRSTMQSLLLTSFLILIFVFSVISIFSFFPQSTRADVTSGLVSRYAFDEGSGTSAADSAGSNTGTLTGGASFTSSGKIGGAVSLSGTSQRVSFGSDFIGTGDVTACAWIYPTQISGGSRSIISNIYFDLYLFNAGGSDYIAITSDNNHSVYKDASFLNQWRHVCAVRSGTTATLYLDGAAFIGPGNSGTPNTAFNVSAGAYPTNQNFFAGSLDEVRVYNRALSASEIASIYSFNGNGGGTSQQDVTPPSVPTGLISSNVSQTDATISWTASSDTVGVTGYRLYQNSVQIAAPAATTYNVTSLSASTTYSFTVAAIDAAGNLSAQSSPLAITTQSAAAPSPYTIAIIKSGTGSGTVTSSSGGINCGSTCTSGNINAGTSVTLTALATNGSTFAGWSGGGCSGTGSCPISSAASVTATFNLNSSSSGNTINAASCAQSAVQAAINQSVDGDTVRIPACASTVWTSQVTISNKRITIAGAGQGLTVINPTGSYAFQFITDKSFDISGMTINSVVPTIALSIEQYTKPLSTVPVPTIITGFRIHHITFVNRGMILWSIAYGLVDHNNFSTTQITTSIEPAWLYAEPWPYTQYAAGESARSMPIEWGTDKFLYVEDNTFSSQLDDGNAVMDGTSGSRVVFRYNNVIASHFAVHAAGNNGRGFVAAEIYENNFDGTFPGGKSLWPGQLRAGTFLIFNNKISNFQYPHFIFDNQRSTNQNPNIGWGMCDGTKAVDGNLEPSGWPCLDQIGRGVGPVANQPTQPAYVWQNGVVSGSSHPFIGDGSSNAGVTVGQEAIIKSTPHINGDIDFCLHSPATPCGNRAAWSYTPYVYPHPLQNAGGPSAPTTYNVTVSLSGSGSGTVSGNGVSCSSSICTASPSIGSSLVLTATAANGSTFTSWSGCSSTSGSTCTVSGAATPVATFTSSAPADTTAPSVSISSPSNGATLSGTVNLVASAADNVGVSGVQFKLDGSDLGTELSIAPYSGTWNTSGVSNGTHTLNAVARDAAGNRATSTSVTITVSNTAPVTPPVIPPTGGGGTTGGGSTTGGGTTSSGGSLPPTGTFTPTVPQPTPANGTTCTPTTIPSTLAPLPVSTTPLTIGSRGTAVTTLQTFLVSKGYLTRDSITGYFGPLTSAAVTKYKAALLPRTIECPTTPVAAGASRLTKGFQFTATLIPFATNVQVKSMQIFLNDHGYPVATTGSGSRGNETTYFGNATKAALIKFQKANNISPAIGNWGPLTRAKVNLMLK